MLYKKLSLVFVFLIVVSFVSAIVYPHAFEGDIIVKDGKNPNGLTIIAYLNDVPIKSDIIEGIHYYLIIEDFKGNGGKISFKIGEEEAEEKFNFVPFEKTYTNLTFDTVSEIIIKECGDGVCQDGECSECPADCSVNICSGNGVCDIDVGEDCSNAPEDCGVCEYCGDGTCNNGETCSTCASDCGKCPTNGGGGSSGGGGGGGSTITTNEDKTNETNSSNENTDLTKGNNEIIQKPISVTELNTMNKSAIIEKKNKGFFSWITGNVIGDSDNNGIVGNILFWLLLILIALIVSFWYLNKRKNNSKRTINEPKKQLVINKIVNNQKKKRKNNKKKRKRRR